MKGEYKMKNNRVVSNFVLAGLVITSTMAIFMGCARTSNSNEEPKTFIDVTEDGKKVTAFFNETCKGTAGGSGISINDNEYLVIDSQITAGAVQVKVVSGGDNINEVPPEDKPATIEYEFDSIGITEYYEIPAGNYMVTVNTTDKATGSITCSVVDRPKE